MLAAVLRDHFGGLRSPGPRRSHRTLLTSDSRIHVPTMIATLLSHL
jgi:hypothetical protein